MRTVVRPYGIDSPDGVGSVVAQSRVVPSQTQQPKQTDSVSEFRADFIKASEEYEVTLQKLLVQYESDLQKLLENSAKWKGLLDEGIISRREYEAKLSGSADAQVKVDELRKQIKGVEVTIARRSVRHLTTCPSLNRVLVTNPNFVDHWQWQN